MHDFTTWTIVNCLATNWIHMTDIRLTTDINKTFTRSYTSNSLQQRYDLTLEETHVISN